MKKKLITSIAFVIAFLAFVPVVMAMEYWNLEGSYTLAFECTWGCSGTYVHELEVTDQSGGVLMGDGSYVPNPAFTWDMEGMIDESDVEMMITYTGVNAGYWVELTGVVAPDGSMSGEAVSSSGQEFDWSTTSGMGTFMRMAKIMSPMEDEIVMDELHLKAMLMDNDEDPIQWAVRKGTCAMGTNTWLGNVDGHHDTLMMMHEPGSYMYKYYLVEDVSSWPAGKYCFIFNPREDAGEADIRLTREFYLADGHFNGGGQIIEEMGGKPKDDYKVSFGGNMWDLGSEGYMGDLEVNFHNVGDDDFDKTKFHGSEVLAMNFFTPTSTTCTGAMNATVRGTFDGTPGYGLIIRVGDSDDTVRFQLYDPMHVEVYDTHDGEFTDESSCVGTARTGLDRGNVTLWMR